MPRLTISFFGDLGVCLNDEPITGFRSRKNRALLAYLTLNRGQLHHREALMELLWPNDLRQAAQQSLRSSLRDIRQQLAAAGDWLEAPNRASLQIRPDIPITTDVEQFQRLSQGKPIMERLQEAVALYTDHFLADFYIDDANPFEAWAAGRRSLLQRQAQSNLQTLIDLLLVENRPDDCLPYVDQFLLLDNLNEAAHCAAMSVWAALGDRASVVQQYETLTDLLDEELGVAPAEETVALKESLLAGQHRAPRKNHVVTTVLRRHNLSAEPLPFFGREALIEQLSQQIQTPDCRLLTILAPGGMGKTRLAREVGQRCLDAYADGVWFVDLVSLTSAGEIPGAIADTLQLPPSPDLSVEQQVLNFLKDRELLIILDNYEHLLPGVDCVMEMLQQAPALAIMVTSRERLNLASEQMHPLTGLTVPKKAATAQLQACESGQLFLSFARRWLPALRLDEETVGASTAICQLIGGMPLGLIMAAAWLETLSLPELAAELKQDLELLQTDFQDIPVRQRNMAQLFESTWARLTANEQGWLAGLAIFQGGFDRYAAQTIVNLPLLGLKKLQAKALVMRSEGGRYHLHELIRQFARRKLEQRPALFYDLGDRHSSYYCQRLVAFYQGVWSHQVKAACDRADIEAVNLFAGWQWAIDRQRWERVGEALDGFTMYTDIRFLNNLLRQACTTQIPILRATNEKQLLTRFLSIYLTELPVGEEKKRIFREAIALLEEIDPEQRWEHRPSCMAFCSNFFLWQDTATTTTFIDNAIECALRHENELMLNWLWMRKAQLLNRRGEFESAHELFEKALQIASTTNIVLAEAQTLAVMANALVLGMFIEEAEAKARKSLALFAQMEYAVPFHIDVQDTLQLALGIQGKFAENLQTLNEDLAVAKASGWPWVHFHYSLEAAALDLGQYDLAKEHMQILIAQDGAENSHLITLCAQGDLALLDGKYEESVRFYGQFNDFKSRHQLPQMLFTNAQQALGYIGLGDLAKARNALLVALSVARRARMYPAPNALIALAKLQLKEHQIASSWETWAVASQYPVIQKSHYIRDLVGAEIEAASLTLPPTEREAIWQRGQTADFWAYIEAAAAQLESEQPT